MSGEGGIPWRFRMEVAVPDGADGTIVGCDDVIPTAGAEVACMRSYAETWLDDAYFANGYCTAMSRECIGSSYICSPVGSNIGDYDAMVECPEGSILLGYAHEHSWLSYSGTVHGKICVLPCEDDNDCRGGEYDPVLQETTQYQCITDDAPVSFCYDPRNLPADYTLEPFLPGLDCTSGACTLICQLSVDTPLAAGATVSLTASCILPDVATDSYHVGAIADPDDELTESNEDNNALADSSGTLTVSGPDYDLAPDITWDDSPVYAGDDAGYSVRVYNYGSDAVGEFDTHHHLRGA
ncbi:MAG: CARDB domain-containing protein [Polyangia bacterium]